MEMRSKAAYKRSKKTTVSLTSLLDLLFVMIFVSLIQQKTVQPNSKPKPVAKKEVKAPGKIIHIPKAKAKPKKVTKAKPKTKAKPSPVAKTPKTFGIDAIFHFHSTPGNPNLPSGKYNMYGSFDEKTRKLQLGGVGWIERPKNYDMVPLSGTIDKSNSFFTGRIEFATCKTFNLKRVQVFEESPISGVWKGVYDCAQGATGLTLTIK